MKKGIGIFLGTVLPLIITKQVFAVCPVCTVAVVAGLGLSRWLGVDDTVSGVWIGGLIVSSGVWLSTWLIKKNVHIPLLPLWCTALFYPFVFLPLWMGHIIGHPNNVLWGMDKLIVGTIAGTVGLVGGILLDTITRKKHNGKVLFFYQKVIFPIALLIIASLVFYGITKK